MFINQNTLKDLQEKGVKVSSYDRSILTPSIVHIGLGNFHRSHFLSYLDDLISQNLCDWGVIECDIIPSNETFINALKEQDYLYTLLSLSPEGKEEIRINKPILGYENASIDSDRVLGFLTSKDTKLITLTITEKGYTYDDERKTLDIHHPYILNDLNNDKNPKSAIGLLSKALSLRAKENTPVIIMSCDNIPENGIVLKHCIMEYCEKKYPESVEWIDRNIQFPSTMVDRITPGTREEDKKYLKEKYGIDDYCSVHAEEYKEWVIEETLGLPPFDMVGARIVKDVKPYELMKIRLLNGSHSALSYPAYIMGINNVDEAAKNKTIRKFIRNYYMEDIGKTLKPLKGINYDSYKDELIHRFSNSNISDKILRLASDGSKKISNAILRPLEEGLSNVLKMESVILALAIWEYFFFYKDSSGASMPIDDPKKNELQNACTNPKEFLQIAGLAMNVIKSDEIFKKIDEYINLFKASSVQAVIEDFMA